MKKKIYSCLIIIAAIIMIFSVVYATGENNEEKSADTGTGTLIQMKEKELESLEDYKNAYGSDSYGVAAYVLNKVRIYSIPLIFVGIAISAIYQYVIGIRKLDVRDKGFSTMIAIITIGVICQILPLIFAIVVKSGIN